MQTRLAFAFAAALLGVGLSSYAADKPKATAPPVADPYAEVQPVTESLNMAMYQRIRDEGLNHSHVMEFASALMDGIGPRLTGSPNAKKANQWSCDTLTKIGLENAHLEDWGEFGLGWQQINTWARMVTPDTAILIVQATPWSPSTTGPVTAEVVSVTIQDEKGHRSIPGKTGRQDRTLWSDARSSPSRKGTLRKVLRKGTRRPRAVSSQPECRRLPRNAGSHERLPAAPEDHRQGRGALC
jgi:hypothetical protein